METLHLALESNREIGAAVGVLMSRGQLTYLESLNNLKAASQTANRRLRDVAADVLRTGQLPESGATGTGQQVARSATLYLVDHGVRRAASRTTGADRRINDRSEPGWTKR